MMSLNFGFNVGVRSGHHRHPNTVEAAELLHEFIHFLGANLYVFKFPEILGRTTYTSFQ